MLGFNTGVFFAKKLVRWQFFMQPLKIAVFDAPSEDSSCNEPKRLGTTTSKNASLVFLYQNSPLLSLVYMLTASDL